MVQSSLTWIFFSWLFLGLTTAFSSMWFVGELTRLYWMPCLTKMGWMLGPTTLMGVWSLMDVVASVAQFLVWHFGGGWETGALGPLLLAVIFMLLTVVWHMVFYWFYQYTVAFYISIILVALAIAQTIWFWIVSTAAGIIMLIVLIWIGYVSLWNFGLVRSNMVGGKAQRLGTSKKGVIIQTAKAGVPNSKDWRKVWRKSPFLKCEKTLQKNEPLSGNAFGCDTVNLEYNDDNGGGYVPMSYTAASTYDAPLGSNGLEPATSGLVPSTNGLVPATNGPVPSSYRIAAPLDKKSTKKSKLSSAKFDDFYGDE